MEALVGSQLENSARPCVPGDALRLGSGGPIPNSNLPNRTNNLQSLENRAPDLAGTPLTFTVLHGKEQLPPPPP